MVLVHFMEQEAPEAACKTPVHPELSGLPWAWVSIAPHVVVMDELEC
jgi:hypothetical protein